MDTREGEVMESNFFPTGRPAAPEDVVDREEFIREAVERVLLGNDIVLAGPRRTGKSSVAGEVLRRVKERGAYIAYVDVFRASSIETFATRLMQAAIENRTGFFRKIARDMQELGKTVGQAKFAANIHDLELGVQFANHGASPEQHLEIALQTAEKIAEADGRRMIILLDEFQDIEKLGGEKVLKQMRGAIQHQRNAVYLFMGSQAHLMDKIFSDPDRAFFRFAIQMQLPKIPWVEWENYIRDRLGRTGLSITDGALQILGEKTGGHPHCVMVVMEAALLRARLSGRQEIGADDIVHGYGAAFLTLSGIYAQQWANVKGYTNAPAVLMQIVEGRRPYSLNITQTNVTQAIDHLEEIGLITRIERGRYRLNEPMFGEWLLENT